MTFLSIVTTHGFAAAASVLIYIATTRVRHQRRTPSTAIAWVLALLFVPYVALPLFLLFGSRAARRPAQVPRPQPDGDWVGDYSRALGLPPRRSGRATVHADASESMASLFATIARATSTLDVGVFLFAGDRFGCDVAERLAARCREGVRVRVMVDGVGLLLKSRDAVALLRASGVDVRIFHAPSVFDLASVDVRNHRKCAIADGASVWMGGRNLAGEYFEDRGDASWRDLTFACEGPVVHDIARQFERDWQGAVSRERDAPSKPLDALAPRPADEGALRFVATGLDQPDDTLRSLILSAAFRARERFLIATPYFVPDSALLDALRLACVRGVDVRILVPARSNHHFADFVRGRSLRLLAGVGATIRLCPRMNHAKLVIVDDDIAFAGSANFDTRSLLINYEAMILFTAPEDVARFAEWMTHAFADSGEFVAARAPLWRDLAEGLLLAAAFET
ncbi:MAG: phospholipase D-like domain-containing protein [Rhodanobacteraceae bacterium]